MIQPIVLALGVHLLLPVADAVPTLDVGPVCRGIALQGGATGRDSATKSEVDSCLKSEQAMRDQIVKDWSTFAASDRTSCVTESRMGGESSYTELLTCLEMARDVRKMRNEPHDALGTPDIDTPGATAPSRPKKTK
jgi:hypothetical protein